MGTYNILPLTVATEFSCMLQHTVHCDNAEQLHHPPAKAAVMPGKVRPLWSMAQHQHHLPLLLLPPVAPATA